ncbi:MAG: phytanoyl-CoA dioxygenase family protein [Bacteroidia bacterium]|nr:phytanoyl-CoA dioxygenase family protein [Bacteroidia bacterium]
MLTTEQINSFTENGYVLIPNVLSEKEVVFLRTRILEIFSTDEWKKSPFNTQRVLSDVYNYFPEFMDITLTEKTINIIKSLLQTTPVLMPETAIHYKFYTGWHKDTSVQEKEGNKFHLKDEALMLQCGFYLQDNDDLGGGLTVMQGSHKTNDNLINPESFRLSLKDRLKLKIGTYKEYDNEKLNPNAHSVIDVKSKAGDLIIFNFRLNHRATRPKHVKLESIPVEKSKIGFFNAFSIDNETANEYLKFIKARKEPFYQSLKSRKPSEDLTQLSNKLKFKAL